jgi:predicted RNase H-like nuclease
VLHATSYQKACDLHEAIDGKRMSMQAFHILAKIREVDGFVRAKGPVAARVHEVHPELAFLRLNDGSAIAPPKRKSEGFELRLNLLTRAIPEEHIEKALNAHSRKDVAKDDVLDALAVMLSARGVAGGKGTRLPQEPVQDAAGVDMAIWY